MQTYRSVAFAANYRVVAMPALRLAFRICIGRQVPDIPPVWRPLEIDDVGWRIGELAWRCIQRAHQVNLGGSVAVRKKRECSAIRRPSRVTIGIMRRSQGLTRAPAGR